MTPLDHRLTCHVKYRWNQTTRATGRRVQAVNARRLEDGDLLHDQLCNTVANRHLKGLLAKVKEDDAYVATKVRIHHAAADDEAARESEARSCRDMAIVTGRDLHGDVRLDTGAAKGRNGNSLGGIKVQARSGGGTPGRGLSAWTQLLETQFGHGQLDFA